VVGADPAVHKDWTHKYTATTMFHEVSYSSATSLQRRSSNW
jgi:hypothetical protein